MFLLWLFFFAQPQSLLQQGLLALKQNQLQQARADLEKAGHLDPNNPYVWSALAEVYLRSKQPKLAASAAQKAEKTGGDNPLVSHALAMYYAEAGNPARAAPLEEKYAESSKADSHAWSRTAGLYLAAGDTKSALPAAKKAAGKSPEAAFTWAEVFLHRQQPTPAADLLQVALNSYPNNPQLVLALGVARYGQRRFADAILEFLKVIKLDPTVQQPYLFLGRILDQAGPHLAEITQDYEKWEAANPKSAKPKLLLAKALLTNDNTSARAEALLQHSIQLDATDWESHYQLGLLLANKHEYKQAAPELLRATQLNAKEPMPHYHLARVYDRLDKPKLAEAQRAIHQQLTANGK